MPFTASWNQKTLAGDLAKMRDRAGYSLRDVAETLAGFSIAKLSRVENGRSRIEPTDVRKLAEHYGADEETIQRLCAMARDSVTDAWWTQYDRWLNPTFVEFLSCEAEAVRAWTVQAVYMPGLLQAREYIAHVLTTVPLQDPDRADAEIEVRVRRQQRLTEAEPLEFHALIGESALHWEFGGPGVLLAQLHHLRQVAELENVHVKVVSFKRPGALYSLDFFEFARDGAAIAFDENQWGTPIHELPLEVRQARREIERLESVALGKDESLKIIEQRIREVQP